MIYRIVIFYDYKNMNKDTYMLQLFIHLKVICLITIEEVIAFKLQFKGNIVLIKI